MHMRIGQGLCWAAVFAFAIAAQAQTDPRAQMISPTPGSTLPLGAVTFTWSAAVGGGDYFLTVESAPGIHDIFNAVVRVTSVTLGPDCNIPTPTNPTTQCIPATGGTIYVTLWTRIQGNYLTPFQYTYTAPTPLPAPPAPTATSVGNNTVTASGTSQSVTLTATVSGGTVNQGTVTFQVLDGAANIGAAVTSAALTTGSASVVYLLPGGLAVKTYTIQANYSGGTNFQPSSGSGTLTVNAAPPVAAPTTTTVQAQTAVFNAAIQSVTLTATVADGSTVNEGTVTFQVKDGATNVGSAVSSATLTNGSASVIYALPAGLAANPYTIQAAYSGGTNFQASSGSGTLTVSPAPPPAQVSTATTANNAAATFSPTTQNVTLTAAVAVPGGTVNQGSVTFQVMNGAANVGAAVPSATLTNGSASVIYALPSGLAAAGYTIQAAYSGGTNFLASSGSGTLTIGKAASTTTFTSTAPASLAYNQTYTPAATSTGDGSLTIGASGSCSIAGGVVTINAGSGVCTITATESEGSNHMGSSATAQTITATKANATVTVNSSTVAFDGQPHSATASTTPSGLSVSFTYNGSATAPTQPGTYAVVGTINDPNYQGSGNGTLAIGKAASTTTFSTTAPASLAYRQTYTPAATSTGDGSLTIGASGSCSMAGGMVTITSGSGVCTITAMESEGNNFLSSSATQSITATKANATVTVNSSTVAFDGQPHSATASTTPSGLSVSFTYNGSATPPTQPGVYAVVGTIQDPNYQGSGNGTLTITTSMGALRAQVESLKLNDGDKNSLKKKLEAAQEALDKGNKGAAANQLGAFINEVQAIQRSGRLDAPTADLLIAQATLIIKGM